MRFVSVTPSGRERATPTARRPAFAEREARAHGHRSEGIQSERSCVCVCVRLRWPVKSWVDVRNCCACVCPSATVARVSAHAGSLAMVGTAMCGDQRGARHASIVPIDLKGRRLADTINNSSILYTELVTQTRGQKPANRDTTQSDTRPTGPTQLDTPAEHDAVTPHRDRDRSDVTFTRVCRRVSDCRVVCGPEAQTTERDCEPLCADPFAASRPRRTTADPFAFWDGTGFVF